jgi:hypothetical protein
MSRCTTGINNTDGKFATCVNNTNSGKLPLVSKTPAVNFAVGVKDTGGKLMGTISDCYMLTLVPKGPNKIFKTLLIQFFPFATRGAPSAANISANFRKISELP